jgi:hypothetical protein
LARHARKGPVVYLTVGSGRADALILTDTPDPVTVVPLPELTDAAIREKILRLDEAGRTAGARDLDPVTRQGAHTTPPRRLPSQISTHCPSMRTLRTSPPVTPR